MDKTALKSAMLQALSMIQMSAIVGEERTGNLPEGIYPCRLMFMCAVVNEGTEEEPKYRPFNAWDGFSLSPDKSSVIVELQSKADEKGFSDPTPQVAMMFEVVHGKYAEKRAHIPYRFNLRGYMRTEDFTEEDFLNAGYSTQDGYAVFTDADGKRFRMISEEKTQKAISILQSAVGAVYADERKEDGSAFDHLDLQLSVEEGNDHLLNVVMKKDQKDPKSRIVPTFFNRYDESRSTFPVEAEAPAEKEEAVMPD